MAIGKRGRYAIFAAIICVGIVAGLLIARLSRKKTAPVEVEPIVLKSTNPATGIAQPGDRVIVEFSLSREPAVPPEVVIGGRAADRVTTVDGINFEASRRISSDESDGPIDFIIRFADAAYEQTSDGSSITLTLPAPKIDIVETDADVDVEISIFSDGDDATIASPGNRASLTISLSEPVSDAPEVVVSGSTATVTRQSDTSYIATHEILETDPEGAVEFSVRLGNLVFKQTTDGSSLLVSNGALAIRVLSVRSDNPRYADRATAGDEITFVIATSDELSEYPDVKINEKSLVKVTETGDRRYEARGIIDESVDDGRLPFTVAVTDLGLDRASVRNATSDGSTVYVDNTPPKITDIRFSLEGGESARAETGDTIWIEFSADEPLTLTPRVSIAENSADAVVELGDGRFRAAYVLREKDAFGSIPFRIEYEDALGNVGIPVTRSDEDTRLAHVTRIPVQPATTESALTEPVDSAPVDNEAVDGEPAESVTAASDEPSEGDTTKPVDTDEIDEIDEIETEKVTESSEAVDTEVEAAGPSGEIAIQPITDAKVAVHVSVEIRKTRDLVADDRSEQSGEAENDTEAPVEVASAIVDDTTDDGSESGADVVDDVPTEQVEPATVDTEADTADADTADAESAESFPGKSVPMVVDTQAALAELTESASILAPMDRSYFGPDVLITGIVKDRSAVSSATYIVSPERFVGQQSGILTGDVAIDAGGVFTVAFPTDKLEGHQQVRIELRYDDGSEAVESIVLLDGGDTIPSFAVESRSNGIEASWDDLSFVSYFSLNVKRLSGVESEMESAMTGDNYFTIDGLQNGEIYEIVVVGFDSDNSVVAQSEPKEAIPIDAKTLEPKVDTRYGSILVRWDPIPAAASYDVFRGAGVDGEMERITVVEDETEYRDAEIQPGRMYRYAIKPAEFDTILSVSAIATSLSEPEDKAGIVAEMQVALLEDTAAYGNNYLLGASGTDGVRIYDVSTPTRPKQVATAESLDAQGLAIYGTLLLVADGENGLRIIDIDSPTKPELISTRKTSDARRISVWSPDEDTVVTFIADGEFGVKLIDITNPFEPTRRATVDTAEAFETAVYGGGATATLFLADGTGGLKIFDARTTGISLINTIDFPDVRTVTVSDDLLIVGDDSAGVILFDVIDPRQPRELSRIAIQHPTDIAIRNEYAYITTATGTVEIINLTSTRLPVRYETVEVPNPQSVTPTLDSIFVGSADSIHVLKNYNRGASFEIAAIQSPGNAYRVVIHERANGERYAGIADHRGGVHIVEVTQPWTVTPRSIIESINTEYARDLAFTRNYLYVADGPAGVLTIDLAPIFDDNPDTVGSIVSSFDTDGNARGIEYANSRLYIADGNRGIKTFGLNDPSRPVQIGSIQTEYAVDVSVHNGFLYVADGDGGTLIYRIDSDSLTRVTSLNTANTRCVATDGNVLGVAGSAGLILYDIQNPESPVKVGSYDTGYAERVALANDYAYMAEGIRGLTILSIANPESIYTVSQFENPFTLDVAVVGDHAYLVDAKGLRIIEIVVPDWVVEGGR